MTIEIFDPADKTLLGPAEVVLRLPGIVEEGHWTPDMRKNPDGTAYFDYTRKQQLWRTDPAVIPGDVNAYRLVGGTDNPKLVEYFVPKEWAQVSNIQTDPNGDKVVFPVAPFPLRALASDEHFVVVRVGVYFTEVWVRKGQKPEPPTPVGGGGLTTDQAAKLDEILMRVRSLTV